MDYINEKLKLLIEENNGLATAADIKKAGISRVQLYAAIDNNFIKKESHGRYVLASDEPDEFKSIQNHSEKLIYSFGTALYLLGYSDRVPHEFDITVPQGDNISRIKKRYSKTNFHYCKKELWNLGITNITTPQGYTVKVYDVERCICDLIKNKKNIDMQVFNQALKEYFSNKCNPRKIIKYARLFNIEPKVRTYMEVLQ